MSDSPPHAQGLVLRLLGEIEVEEDGTALALPPSKKTRALLAYLAVVRRPQRRDRLCAMFWEIPDDPRGALRWSLSKLRALLDRPGARQRHRDGHDRATCRLGRVVPRRVSRRARPAGVP